MTRWFAWFKEEGKVPYFRLLIATTIEVAEMMAYDFATRNKVSCMGIIIAPEPFNKEEV